MLGIVNFNYEFKNSKGEWENLTTKYAVREEEERVIREYHCEKFEDLYQLAEEDFGGLYIDKTFFTKHPQVHIHQDYEGSISFTKKNFRFAPKDFRVRTEVSEPSMHWMVRNVSANELVRLAKSRGWTNINLIME